MCRLFALTSQDPVSPMLAIKALDVMREGHDGSGVGLFLSGLSGPFEDLSDCPVLSGIFTTAGIRRLDQYMMDNDFMTKYKTSTRISTPPPPGTPKRDVYLARAYEKPEAWKDMPQEQQEQEMVRIRLELRRMGQEKDEMTVFSFWPDTIMIKELGDPMTIGNYLQLERKEFNARVILAQGRQNTNYAINLYACHPFFIQGICTMTNGENTAFLPVKEFLESRNVLGYEGYQSDSEVFTHILHFTLKRLGLGLDAYKHIITPLKDEEIAAHPNGPFLKQLKETCRKLIIDGPNCTIGCLPDKSLFMVQDSKKLRPGVVGGKPGIYAFSSEVCGLDAVLPDRDVTKDIQPMHLDTVIVPPTREEIRICRQTDPLNLQH